MGIPEVSDDNLRVIEAALAKSKRYTAICPDTVRRMARKALLSAQGDVTEAIKRTKRGLHEIYGAYLPGRAPNYDSMLRKVHAAIDSGDQQAIKDSLVNAMRIHASTRERLPHLRIFYQEIFRRVPAPAAIRDLACGLNPLAMPWMELPPSVTYLASDIDIRQVDFLDKVLSALNVPHCAEVLDLVGQPVAEPVDLTLLLKTVPCMERQQSGAGWALVDAVNSPNIVLTFSTKSLGQRSKGMFQTYSTAFEEHARDRAWQIERIEISNELIYVVRKQLPLSS